jgi:putrescine transport system permease protein
MKRSRRLPFHRFVLKRKGQKFLSILPKLWLVFFLVIPFLLVLGISFSESAISIPPYKTPFSWLQKNVLSIQVNLQNYGFILSESLYFWSFLQSLTLAFLTTLICLLLAYPLAYAIVRAPSKWQFVWLILIVLPFWISFLVRVYAWFGLLMPHGLINAFLMKIGVIQSPLPLMGNLGSVLTGMVYSYLPFMVVPLYATLEKLDFSLVEAAYDLGARPRTVFWRIIVPLSREGALTGSMLVFIPTIGEFVVPELLGGSRLLMVGQMIWNEFFYNRDWPLAAALSVLILCGLSLPIYFFQKFQKKV